MALVDDPKSFILRMFQMEAHEGRGVHCKASPEGVRPPGLQLGPDERVYGIYKGKYFFTPQSFLVRNGERVQRVQWNDVIACSTSHGCGKRECLLTLSDGSTVVIQLHELAKGWAGRTSQLLHGMIERWGGLAPLGPPLLSLEEFARRFDDPDQFAPNLEPHPSVGAILESLRALESALGVHKVFLSRTDDEDQFVVTGVVVLSDGRPPALDEFSSALGASGVVEAPTNTRRKVNAVGELQVWEVLWD